MTGGRALAHIGLPVSISDPRQSGDASYVFAGTMRWRRPDAAPSAADATAAVTRGRSSGDGRRPR